MSENFIKIIAPLLAVVLAFILGRIFKDKPKLIHFYGHVSVFKLNDTKADVFTHNIIIRNIGKEPAKNIKIGHNNLPKDYVIYPPSKCEVEVLQDGTEELIVPSLLPKEQMTISYLYFPPLTYDKINTSCKHESGFSKYYDALPTPMPSKKIIWLIYILMGLGILFIINLVLAFSGLTPLIKL